MRFKADVECVEERQGTPLTYPEAAGGCRVREVGRVGLIKVVVSQALGGGEMSSERKKKLLFSTSSLRLGVWWVVPASLVCEIGRPGLWMSPPRNSS
jgi:hypothetical protein